MPLLNPPNILPNGMHLIARYLTECAQPVEQHRLKSLLQPPTLKIRADGTNTFDACLKALQDLRLVVRAGGTVAAAPQLAVPSDVRAFGEALVLAICGGATDGLDESPQRDLLSALTWWCAQDPYGSPLSWQEVQRLLSHDMGESFTSFAIGNSNPWLAFVRWATALGFAEYAGPPGRASSTIVPDITRAVRTVIRSREWTGPVPASEFVSFLRHSLPVVDGGRLTTRLRPGWDLPPGRRAVDNALDVALSHALLCNEESGAIAMGNPSDAPDKVLLSDGPNVRIISVVTVQGVQR
ncbi:protein DpdG [Micromonospora aurantiaca (nom. illeg.)]|uniref:protein DpdG n=1 Tax=Micromonospora aurantiaca (nom. illeg.) TaxID=47850 RepID=UPI00161D5196